MNVFDNIIEIIYGMDDSIKLIFNQLDNSSQWLPLLSGTFKTQHQALQNMKDRRKTTKF